MCAKKRIGQANYPVGKETFTFFRVMTGEVMKREGEQAHLQEG